MSPNNPSNDSAAAIADPVIRDIDKTLSTAQLCGSFEEFMEKNYFKSKDGKLVNIEKFILKVARKISGHQISGIREVYSDAYLAWRQWKWYHSHAQPTKPTSSYTWYLTKVFEEANKTDFYACPVDNKVTPRVDTEDGEFSAADVFTNEGQDDLYGIEDDDALSPEEKMFFAPTDLPADAVLKLVDCSKVGIEGIDNTILPDALNQLTTRTTTYGEHFVICLKSFKDTLLPPDLKEIFRSLEHQSNYKSSNKKVTKKYRSVKLLSKKIRQRLINQTKDSGYTLYVAICLNGALNRILVAAKSPQKALKWLKPYGVLQQLKEFVVPESTHVEPAVVSEKIEQSLSATGK